MLQKKIDNIEFRILNPEMIRKMSAIEIKTAETYDRDGYPMEEGLMDSHLGVINPGLRCKTCGQKMKECPGHFGSFELVRPVTHAKFSKKVETVLMLTCKDCGRILLKEEDQAKVRAGNYKGELLIKKVKTRSTKIKKCPYCQAKRPKPKLDKPTNFYLDKERIYPHAIREWLEKVPDTDLELLAFNPKIIRPEWLILTVMPIPPITIRPSITLETGIKSEDDLTHKLVDIVRINQRLKENIDAGAPQLIIEDLWDLLQYHVTTYFDNQIAGVPPSKHRSGRALRTVVQRLKGKKGRFRYNLTGKRVNFAARSTISPDPFISINEVGVPEGMVRDLTLSELGTEWNLKRLKKTIADGYVLSVVRPDGRRKIVTPETMKEIEEELAVGYKIERQLLNGDIVLFNRQPSLHRLSMLAHRVKILPGKTLRLNPIVCKPYNADFDGDEMNLHVPQTEEGKTEALELMLVQNQVLSPRYGMPIVILDEDGISGSTVLTLDTTELDRETAYRYFYEMGIKELPKPDRGNKYSGKLIFSQLLPKDLTMKYRSKMCTVIQKADADYECKGDKCPHCVEIVNGELVRGVIDDYSLGEGKGKLVYHLAKTYAPEILEQFYYKINRVISDILTKRGMTASLDEYEINEETQKFVEKAVKEGLTEAEKLVEQYRKKDLQLLPGRTLQQSFEMQMMMNALRVKEKAQKKILKEKLGMVLNEKPKLNTVLMIIAGARGSSLNLMNMAGFWGQVAVREGRPKRGFRGRTLSLFKRNDVGAIAHGFVQGNFMSGMNVTEYFFHAMGGRQGEVDTGVSTKVSGYLYRRLANSLKDLSVKGDLTVRTSDGKIMQYLYGEDGVFPMNSKKGEAVDMDELYEKLNEKEKKK
ncbi:MAG: DNA-directed RNA polymerase subunit A' [Candidatus Diapherotrites archaeon]|nr:DNA-directed RNA polymerase subunit A' [Candidatus Diapherotrites archaeon]